MRAKVALAIIVCFLAISACASSPKIPKLKLEDNIRKYDIVSMDLSICGIFGTLPVKGEMEIIAKRGSNEGDLYIKFSMTDPVLGGRKIDSKSELFLDAGLVAFKIQNSKIIGYLRYENRENGEYLIINMPNDPEEITYKEDQLKTYKNEHPNETVTELEARIEKLKKGFDWVFKKK